MADIEIEQIPVLNDNYIYLIHEPSGNQTAIVDPAEAAPVIARLEQKGWVPTFILNTHHHPDHVGGNLELKDRYGLTIVGAGLDQHRLPGLDQPVAEGDVVKIGEAVAHVLDVPGHTKGHIAYWFSEENALFCGDTLFSLGCGRLFEGTPGQMWQSLSKLKRLPAETQIYCAHEYTLANAHFAVSVDPNNYRLKKRVTWIEDMRRHNRPTIPTSLEQELALNPFLRADDPGLAKALGLDHASAEAVFAEVRQRKDNF